MTALNQDPHGNQPLLEAGTPLEEANALVVLLHGRGSPAANIIQLGTAFQPAPESEQQIAFRAPQADSNTWYPYRFLVPVEQNEPYLSSALTRIDGIVDQAVRAGLHSRQVAVVGFSQGACLALEYAARGSRQIGVVAAFAGGLIGDPDAPRATMPDQAGLNVFIGCGDRDDHIDIAIAERCAKLFSEAGADVDFRRYPGVPHTILDDEVAAARSLIHALPLIGPSPVRS